MTSHGPPAVGGDDLHLSSLEDAWRRDPDAVFVRLAASYRAAGRLDEARTLLDDGLDRIPGHLAGRVQRARLMCDDGDHDGARRELAGVLTQRPAHWSALWALADVARDAGDRPGEAAVLAQLVDLAPDDPAVLRRRREFEQLPDAPPPPRRVAPEEELPRRREPWAERELVPWPDEDPSPTEPDGHRFGQPAGLDAAEGSLEGAGVAAPSAQTSPDARRFVPQEGTGRPGGPSATSVTADTAPSAELPSSLPLNVAAPLDAPAGHPDTGEEDEVDPDTADAEAEADDGAAPDPSPPPPAAPSDPFTNATMAELLAAQGDTDSAISMYRELIAREPQLQSHRRRYVELGGASDELPPLQADPDPDPARLEEAMRHLVDGA